MSQSQQPTVADNPAENRYEIKVGDELAGFAEYRVRGDQVELTHTQVFEQFSGQGLAQQLAAAALDDVRSHGRGVVPTCPFIAGYVRKNPEYVDLVPADRRAEFDLV